MERILQALKEAKVTEYTLKQETIYGKEWFFIGKKIDLSRAKKVRYYELTVYQTVYECQKRYKGSATCRISDCEDEKRLQERIAALYEEAGYVKNDYYELPGPSDVPFSYPDSSLGTIRDVFEMIEDFHETDHIHLNSFELFETIHEVHLINSKGIDVRYSYPSHELEWIVNATDEHHEIEIYQDLQFGQINIAELKRQIGKAKIQAEDRLYAVPLRQEHLCDRIIISGENVLRLFEYYLIQLRADFIYRQYSSLKIGQTCGPDHFHLEGLNYLDHAPLNRAYDDDGRPCRSVSLVEDGTIVHIWGNHMYSSYLNQQETTMLNYFKVGAGTLSIDQMREAPHLEIVQFSAFSCHPITGDFSGEIRLAYFVHEDQRIPVYGGSISGNIKDHEKTMVLAKELEKFDRAVAPCAIQFEHLNIACE